jgi:small-conductance mechanosensitive channel
MDNHTSRTFGDGIAALAALVLVLLFWLLVMFAHQVARAFAKHPKSVALWLATLVCLTSWLAVAMVAGTTSGAMGTGGSALVNGLLVVAAVATGFLWLTAKAVEARHDDLLPIQRAPLVERVLQQNWWPPLRESW